MSGELVRYDAMCHAIAAAYQIDEVKDIRDKAIALEVYARQARNTEAERQACEIRLRAERKAGQLTAKLPTARGERTDLTSSHGATKFDALAEAGISPDQASKWERLGGIPDDVFETALHDGKPTTNGIISAYAPSPERDALKTKALWLWGRLQDFEREGLLEERPADLLAVMSDHMRATTLALSPRVIEWLGGLNDDG
jgi:hypothetical protein